MKIISILITELDYLESQLTILGEKFHHLVHVKRCAVGDELHAALPNGRVLCARVSEITSASLLAQVTSEEAARGISPCQITLYQAILKGDKMELVIQKASELGATTFVPLQVQRSIPRWNKAQQNERVIRWQRIADAAAEQCERSIAMQICHPTTISEALQNDTVNFLLHEREGISLQEIISKHPTLSAIGLFLGPEGGWHPDETTLALAAGVIPLNLGGRILRAETASIAVLTLAQYLWGDLGNC